jgi:hypothetical protein
MRTALVPLLAGVLAAQHMPPDEFARWREWFSPSEDDAAFRRIDWRIDPDTASAEAAARDRPLLLWTMNGNPLGFT